MTWVRYDDNVRNHPKVESLDDATYRLWREAIEWCAQNLTDGVILARQLGLTSTRASPARARKLVERELWHKAGEHCDSEHCPPSGVDGWVIHDYLDYQPTRGRVIEEQGLRRERNRRYAEKARGKRGTSRDRPKDASSATSKDASRDGYPAPPRPEGGGGGTPPETPAAATGGVALAAGEEGISLVRLCRTCSNAPTSAYHRNVCREDPAA